MNPPLATISPAQLLGALFLYPRRWLLPAAVLAGLAGAYALFHTPNWEASQALIVRNEAASEQPNPGKFNYPEEMKTVQETILELVRSGSVLTGALKQVGAPADYRGEPADWPTPQDVADLREAVKLTPPRGAEFGRTEVFYLKVQDRDRDRAVALATAICSRLEAGFQELRDARARSMTGELAKAVNLAQSDLAASTKRLTETETQVGSDLAELRLLQDSNSGDSALRRTVTEIRNELRQASAAVKSSSQLMNLLQDAQKASNRLAAIPHQLIESQPALRRLKEGLADAQLRTAQLAGAMSDQHPLVQAAREAEREIDRNLQRELATALHGVEIDLRLNTDRVKLLEEQLVQTSERLNRLSAIRATYANLAAETRNRATLLERAEQRLAEARASEATAKAASLIARIDVPDAGIRPVGPGRATIALGGIAGGLLAGLGILFLTLQPLPSLPELGNLAEDRFSSTAEGARRNGSATPDFGPACGLSLNQALGRIATHQHVY